MSDLLDKRVDKLLAKLRKNDDDCAHLPLLDESYELLERLQAENNRYRTTLASIADPTKTTGNGWADRNLLRGFAHQALNPSQTYSREVTP